MIELTKLNGNALAINSDLIKTAEASPDTMITLVNGEKLIVRESLAELVERVRSYRTGLLSAVAKRMSSPSGLSVVASVAAFDSADNATSRAASVPEIHS